MQSQRMRLPASVSDQRLLAHAASPHLCHDERSRRGVFEIMDRIKRMKKIDAKN